MYLYEYQAKRVVSQEGIPVPASKLVTTKEKAGQAVEMLGKPAVVKAQVRAGGRGKAGLIKMVTTPAEASLATEKILGASHNGETVRKILIEEQLHIDRELYVSIVLDVNKGVPVALLSSQGGVNIEEVAAENPRAIVSKELDPLECRFPRYKWLEMWRKAGLEGKQLMEASTVTAKMLELFYKLDALTIEVNPLAVTQEGAVIAADSKVIIDDAGLYRQKDLQDFSARSSNPLEAAGSDIGVNYVALSGHGQLGIIAGGAGLSMATMDAVIEGGGEPAAFLDLGGGISEEVMAESLRIMLQTKELQGIIINVFGGINNCEVMAKGIQQVFAEAKPQIPMVVKMRGHSQEAGWAILDSLQIPYIMYGTTEQAIKLLLEIVSGGGGK